MSRGATCRPVAPVFEPRRHHAAETSVNIRTALREAIVRLESESVPSAALAAELLLLHVMQRDRAWIYAHPEAPLSGEEWQRYFALIARRAAGSPVQHLTGVQEFWGLEFEVTPDVLIPRPETEHLVEVALERLGVGSGAGLARHREEFRIADVGTGSGCIAIALAHELPAAHIMATDMSAAALEVARRNAARLGVAERITFVECNLLDAVLHQSPVTGHASRVLSPSQSPLFDLIVSNPPYIGRREAATLPREVREHEPETALFGGEVGTELYQPLITQAAALVKPGGYLVLELGYNSAEHVTCALNTAEWTGLSITTDLAGIRRVACAKRTAVRSA